MATKRKKLKKTEKEFFKRNQASVVIRQHSSSLKQLDRFTSKLVCSILVTVTHKFAHIVAIGTF
jgi:hypothetical protein